MYHERLNLTKVIDERIRQTGRGFEAAGRALGSGLQGDRQSIARGVNAIWKRQQQARERQRGPERDFGPSR